ncbi:hypothetical protein SRABI106_04498 [Rahnella aquatilis]|nr:hypothetical protein SRABI106_04498 [Rahnella aquatilis]
MNAGSGVAFAAGTGNVQILHFIAIFKRHFIYFATAFYRHFDAF